MTEQQHADAVRQSYDFTCTPQYRRGYTAGYDSGWWDGAKTVGLGALVLFALTALCAACFM